MTLENLHFAKQIKKTLDKWKRPLFLLNIFKIFFLHVSFSCIPRIHKTYKLTVLQSFSTGLGASETVV